MTITDHAKERIIERTDFAKNRNEAERVAKIAWHSGYTIGQVAAFNVELASYMDKKKTRNGNHGSVRFYKGNIYIWRGKGRKRLITSYPAPKRYLEISLEEKNND